MAPGAADQQTHTKSQNGHAVEAKRSFSMCYGASKHRHWSQIGRVRPTPVSKRTKRAPRGAMTTPRGPKKSQDDAKRVRNGNKRPQNCHKMAPNWSQNSACVPQITQTTQTYKLVNRRGATLVFDVSVRITGGQKLLKWPQESRRSARTTPRSAKTTPKAAETSPRGPKAAQTGPQEAPK